MLAELGPDGKPADEAFDKTGMTTPDRYAQAETVTMPGHRDAYPLKMPVNSVHNRWFAVAITPFVEMSRPSTFRVSKPFG